jgi:uncharacterized phage-associated protein
MASPVLNVANAFIQRARESGQTIDPLKLQKLVYIAHGWKLAFTGKPLIDESFEAWRYGPVVPELYREFREFKAGPINRLAKAQNEVLSRSSSESVDQEIIDQVWEKYSAMTAIELSQMTHEPGSAWSQTYASSLWGSPIIPNALIQDEFLVRGRLAGSTDC